MRQIAWRIVVIQICLAASISGAISGKVSGNTYTSPGGLFKMEIPNKYNVKQRIDDLKDQLISVRRAIKFTEKAKT